jgi:hypothetical protein
MLPIAVLVVTGAEALYADMGHFGARAIRLGWFAIVMPALTLCYLGQGAMVLAGNDSFFALAPAGAWRYGFIGLATAATVIASQALIAGAFSLTRQAVRLGLFPRVTVKHTSDEREGQLYVPLINWGLASGCIGLVLIFQHSQRLASAYGVAVTGTMSITSVVFYEVARPGAGHSGKRRCSSPSFCRSMSPSRARRCSSSSMEDSSPSWSAAASSSSWWCGTTDATATGTTSPTARHLSRGSFPSWRPIRWPDCRERACS